METFSIGQLASRASVNVETVRFYERKGLIRQPQRTESYRVYSTDDLNSILFIRQAKNLGFTLQQIKELLYLRLTGPKRCDAVRPKTEAKLGEVREKIRALRQMESALARLIQSCMAEKPTDRCTIMGAFEEGSR